jgi:hypothetical protein
MGLEVPAMTAAPDAARAFVARLHETPIKVAELAGFLDGLSHEERVAAIRAAGRAEQRVLWKAVDGFGEVRLVDLVAPRVADLATVRHHGRNTLPVFTRFEKRMCRPAGRDPERPGELWGFNFQTLEPITGPGYFVVREDRARGEAWVDYREVPPEAPPGWPPVRGNEVGLGRFVYGGMVDTLRRVSEHVTIGSAARAGREMGSWFLLCRES